MAQNWPKEALKLGGKKKIALANILTLVFLGDKETHTRPVKMLELK